MAVATAAAMGVSGAASASTIGNWIGSSRSWNSADMSIVRGTMLLAGHTVEGDEALSAANLANNDLFIIGEPGATPTAGELAALSAWVSGGGILLMLADSSDAGLPALNNISAGLGAGLTWSGGAGSNTPLAGGNFATTGPPFNIVGQLLNVSPGTAVTAGGISLSGDYLRVQSLGAGWIFAFADRVDHNVFNPTAANTNGQLFLNIAGAEQVAVPEPATLLLTTLGAAGLIRRRLRRS